MCHEVEKAAVSGPGADRPHRQGAENHDQHDAEVGYEGQGERVVEAQALERVATEEAANQLPDAGDEPQPIAGHGNGESGADARDDGTESAALPAEHRRSRSL